MSQIPGEQQVAKPQSPLLPPPTRPLPPIPHASSTVAVSPPRSPDCILWLRDKTMIAVSSSSIEYWLTNHGLVQQDYKLPVYRLDEDPDAVQLFLAIIERRITVGNTDLPPCTLLGHLANLAVRAQQLDQCRPLLSVWLRQRIQVDGDNITPQVLDLAMTCGDLSDVVNACRALVMCSLQPNEVEEADKLLGELPPSMSIKEMRIKLRETLQRTITLPFTDHKFLRRPVEDTHMCWTGAMDLAMYVAALSELSIFPCKEQNAISLLHLTPRLNAAAAHMPDLPQCEECEYSGRRWHTFFGAVAAVIAATWRSQMKGLEEYLAQRRRTASV